MASSQPKAVDVCLIAGGKYHDIDFARRELLSLLAEHERVRVRVVEDYRETDAITKTDFLVTYVCDIIPDDAQIAALQAFLAKGGKWLALHGTNSTLEFMEGNRVRCPPLPEKFLDMIGSQFMAHPPIGRYKVKQASDDPLVAGIGDFHVEDEHYLQDERPGNEKLLVTRFSGTTSLFERAEWPDREHLVMYRRKTAGGEVLYLTLGHARGRYDMRPLADFYPLVERGAWQLPVFYELLRRGIRWGVETL